MSFLFHPREEVDLFENHIGWLAVDLIVFLFHVACNQYLCMHDNKTYKILHTLSTHFKSTKQL